jgi:hypothetical protein
VVRLTLEVTARAEIKEHRCWDDRHDMVRLGSDLQSPLVLGEPPHHAPGGIETICTSSRQTDGVDSVHHRGRMKAVRLPRARSATSNINSAY